MFHNDHHYHTLLRRQIRKYLDLKMISRKLKTFLEAVNQSYKDFEDDLRLLERSMDLSSKELVQINADLNAIFQAIPDLFLKIDANGKILDCKAGNPEDLLWADPHSMLGKRIQDVPQEEAARKLRDTLEVVGRKRVKRSVEYALTISGKERFYEARFVPLNEDQIVVIIRAITDKKKWEKEIYNSLHDLKQFKDVTVDRELRMIELKQEINAMAEELGKEKPYDDV